MFFLTWFITQYLDLKLLIWYRYIGTSGYMTSQKYRYIGSKGLMHILSNSDETNKNILNSDLGIMKVWADLWLIKFSVEKNKIYVC